MDRAGAGGRQAHTGLAGELGVGAGHERGHLLVANLDELRPVAVVPERADDAVDPVARIAVDPLDAPIRGQSFEQVVGDGLAHLGSPFLGSGYLTYPPALE